MPTIADGSNATISVGIDDILTVQCPNGWVRYESPVGTIVSEFGGSRSFGPFSAAGSVKVTSIQRPIYYEVSDLSERSRAVTWADSSGSSLVRPDGTATSVVSEFYNFTGARLTKWRAALAKVQAGTGHAKLACIGDSRTLGATGLTNRATQSWTAQLKSILAARGLPAQCEAMFGCGGTTLSIIAGVDPRITFGTGWSQGGVACFGGNTISFFNAVDAAFNFAPLTNTDTADVYYDISSVGGKFTLTVNGGTSLGQTSAFNATASLGKVTVSYTAGANTLNITGNNVPSFGAVNIVGIHQYLSTTPAVQILPMGWTGSKIADWTGMATPYGPLGGLSVVAPDLTVIDLTVNDAAASSDVATFTANTQLLITAAKAVGDVVLIVGMPPASSFANLATYQRFVTAYYALANSNDIPLIDISARWVSQIVSNALGFYVDNAHGSRTGYADMALAVANAIGSV